MKFVGLAILLVAALGYIVALSSRSSRAQEKSEAWMRARQNEDSLVSKMILGISQPFSRVDHLYDILPTRQYRYIQGRLLASGSFGSDVDVFLSVEAGAVFVGLILIALGFFEKGLFTFVFGALGLLLMVYPWNIVSKKAKARAREVTMDLPDFVELLAMSVSGGMGLDGALSFTAGQVDGVVSDEVRNMINIIRNNPSDEEMAYKLAGERLGTPEAKAFFATLLQSQLEGTRVLDNLIAQAEALRKVAFQRQRAEVKKLPNKMVIILGIHLMPLLFVVALFPLVTGLSKL
jgi:tight adherence protein C